MILLWGCAAPGTLGPPRGEPGFRIGEVAEQGDPRRRASTRLVLEGLASDEQGQHRRALARYGRAVQADATNPFAYLALARHHVEFEQWRRADETLRQAETLLDAGDALAARVEPHLTGLRGAVLAAEGELDAGIALLDEARRLAPDVWDDGVLAASELR